MKCFKKEAVRLLQMPLVE